MKTNIKKIVVCALMAALTAVLSQIAIPMAPVPINLAMLSVFIAGGLLGPINGAISQAVYVALGAIGVPVFASFSAGVGIIVGPTGGYIIGYIIAAFVTGIIIKHSNKSYTMHIVAMIAGLIACYILGTAWFMYVTKTALVASLMMCVVPFLIGDALKIALATILVKRLRKVIKL